MSFCTAPAASRRPPRPFGFERLAPFVAAEPEGPETPKQPRETSRTRMEERLVGVTGGKPRSGEISVLRLFAAVKGH